MTFYNLPDTEVKIEYDKNNHVLVIYNLPDNYALLERVDEGGWPKMKIMFAPTPHPDRVGQVAEYERQQKNRELNNS